MSQVLEELGTAVRVIVEELHWIGPDPREEGHVLGTYQRVDRIELDQRDPIHHTTQVSDVYPTRWARGGEALSPQSDPTRVPKGEIVSQGATLRSQARIKAVAPKTLRLPEAR